LWRFHLEWWPRNNHRFYRRTRLGNLVMMLRRYNLFHFRRLRHDNNICISHRDDHRWLGCRGGRRRRICRNRRGPVTLLTHRYRVRRWGRNRRRRRHNYRGDSNEVDRRRWWRRRIFTLLARWLAMFAQGQPNWLLFRRRWWWRRR